MSSYLENLKIAREKLEEFPTNFKNSYEVDEHFSKQEAEFYAQLEDLYFPRFKDCGLHKTQDFYRVSSYSDKETKVGEFYNPPSCFTPYGRCNYQFYPIFYLSTNPIGAFSEVIRKKISSPTTYYLSKWTCNYSHPLNATIFLRGQLESNHPWKNVEQKYYELVSSKYSAAAQCSVSDILGFVAENFLNDCDYRLSSFLSHQLLYGIPYGSDYLIYPSLREKKLSVNFAFHPKLVQNKAFTFKRAWKFIVSEFEMKGSHVNAIWSIENCFVSPDGFNLVQTDDFDNDFLKRYFNLFSF